MIPDKYNKFAKRQVILRKHVIIGTGTVILPNLIIGEITAVGALSLVNKNLEKWSIYAGNPIKK